MVLHKAAAGTDKHRNKGLAGQSELAEDTVQHKCDTVGMAAIIISGIMLKKTKMFSGDPAPFVMELPAYHMPTVGNILRYKGYPSCRRYFPSPQVP